MLSVVPVGGWGVTIGVVILQKLIESHKDLLIDVMRVERPCGEDTNEFAFIALFRESGTLGQYTAFINEWGTNYGRQAGGEGSGGFEEFMNYLRSLETERNMECMYIEWNSVPDDFWENVDHDSQHERMRAWERVIMDLMFPLGANDYI